MTTQIIVSTFKNTPQGRASYREAYGRHHPWAQSYIARFLQVSTGKTVEGGGSSHRVAAMRAAENAVSEGWF
jgi:hypothetical protein